MEVSDKVRSISWMSARLLCGQEVSPWCCGDANTTMGALAVGRAAALLVPNETSCTASSFGSSISLLEGGTGGCFNQGKAIWWALVIGFMTNSACAIQECNWYDMASVSWKHCHAVLLVLGYTAGAIGSFSTFWGLSVWAQSCHCCLSCHWCCLWAFSSLHLVQSCTKKLQT